MTTALTKAIRGSRAVSAAAHSNAIRLKADSGVSGLLIDSGNNPFGSWRQQAKYKEAESRGYEGVPLLLESIFRKQLEEVKKTKDTDPIGYVKAIKELGKLFGKEAELKGLLESSKIDPRIAAAAKARENEQWKEAVGLLREAVGNAAVAKTAVAMIEEIQEANKEKRLKEASEVYGFLKQRLKAILSAATTI